MAAIGLDGSRLVESSEIEIDARNEKTARIKKTKSERRRFKPFSRSMVRR